MPTARKGRVLRPAQIAERMGVGLSTMWSWAKHDPDFPALFKLGPRTTGGYETEVDDYIAKRAERMRGAA